MRALVTLALLAVASPAWARQIEITPLASYTTSAEIDRTAAGVDDLTISRGFTWGAQGTYFVSTHLGFEVLWAYQSTVLSMSTRAGDGALFSMDTHQILGNVVYQFRGSLAALRPFIFGGGGTTMFSAPDLESESKASWTVGGGLKWFVQEHVGLKGQARYKPTELHDTASSVCDPFGFCQESLKNVEFAGGAVFRF
jgi:hypothetical protein